jgi:hypothetical protein
MNRPGLRGKALRSSPPLPEEHTPAALTCSLSCPWVLTPFGNERQPRPGAAPTAANLLLVIFPRLRTSNLARQHALLETLHCAL